MTSPRSNFADSSPEAAVQETQTQPYRADEASSMLARLLDEYLAELQAGRQPDRAKLLAEHPSLATSLEACLAGMDFIHRAAQPADAPLQIGEFRLLREIGRGGMGVVYEAEQISLRRRVALKVLKIGGTTDRGAIERFQREAETVAHLHHTNIVPIFAVGCDAGVNYYAMQLIQGHSLADVLRAGVDGPQPPPEHAARWSMEAAEALAHAHQRGVIHRDIKPSNILLDDEGRIWLTDFGLARRTEEDTLTVTGALMGTPRYMSPEQASSARRPVDHRTDIYSLGATLYELATRRPLFEADTPHALITQIIDTEPLAPRKVSPELPRDLETIILKCLAKNPGDRYPAARDLADDLRRFLGGDPIRARRPTVWERTHRWLHKRRRSMATTATVATAAAVLAVGGAIAWQQQRESQKGKLAFQTTGPHFKAELLDAADRPTGISFTVPNEDPVRVTPGEYNALLTRDGVLSETVQLTVAPKTEQKYDLDLSGRELWRQFEIPPFDAKHDGYAFVDFGQQTDLVLLRSWHNLLRVPDKEHARSWQDGIRWEVSWHGYHSGGGLHQGAKGFGHTVHTLETLNSWRYLVSPAPQLTPGDDMADLVWVGELGLVALNGENGKVLWHHPWFAAGFPADGEKIDANKATSADAFGRPLVAPVNQDGTPDLIAVVEVTGSKSARRRWQRVVAARLRGTL